MKTLARAVALCAVCSSAVSLAAAPRAEPNDAPQYEEKLSCLPAAKPFFHKAWNAEANGHLDEARKLYTQSVTFDPACTLAWAHLGALTPGQNGRRMLEDAIVGSAAIKEQEKLQVRALAAQQRGDHEQALTLTRSALIYDPGSYWLNFALAQRAGTLQRWSEMVPAAQRATELGPDRGEAWSQLGSAYLRIGRKDLAIAALRRYAEVAPLESNANDALGDALLANNQLEAARVAYQHALDGSGGTLWASNHGVATVCAIQGDWFCARAAIEKARRTAPRVEDRLKLMEWTAWSYVADEQPGEAYRAVDELEQDAGRLGLELHLAEARLLRARLFTTQGRFRDAMTGLIVLGAQKFPTLNEVQRRSIEARRLHGLVEARARVGNVKDAEKTLGHLRSLFAQRPEDPQGLDLVAHAQGLISLQKKDAAAAIDAFSKCSRTFDACKLHLAEAQDAAGEAAEARRTRALVRVNNHRDPEYWWVHVRALEQRPDAEARPRPEDRSSF
ncbi:MAG: tetratricopeptide repeat protein [Archangium sp.]|nr:tetratricopeptide repeat protein [Archangium sp.]MDP3152032.1 tetratricopeptide repeat protein [Archangium sp.]MDP3575482.1 tetratricopeptide repeat protein [Archangium sp.]